MVSFLIISGICIFLVAVLYASVGHGGASGYIAVLSLLGLSLALVRKDALILNILVSAIALFQFYRAGYFRWKLFLPLALASIPMAYLGGLQKTDTVYFKIILGSMLLIPAILFLIKLKKPDGAVRNMPGYLAIAVGAGLGFISGLTGIGGGVFLSPLLLLGRWAGQKTAAATSAAFIFVNSNSGFIAGSGFAGVIQPDIWVYAACAIAGGIIGARSGAWHFNARVLKGLLGVVLLIAAVKLLSEAARTFV